jgi:hypothetical protein
MEHYLYITLGAILVSVIAVLLAALNDRRNAKRIQAFAARHGFVQLKEKPKSAEGPFDLFSEGKGRHIVRVLQGSLKGKQIDFLLYGCYRGEGNGRVLYSYTAALLKTNSELEDFSLLRRPRLADHIKSKLPEQEWAGRPNKYRLHGTASLPEGLVKALADKYSIEKRGGQVLVWYLGNPDYETFFAKVKELVGLL